MFWDSDLGCINMDVANKVGNKYYFRGEEIPIFITRVGNNLYSNDDDIIAAGQNAGHAHRLLKEAVKNNKLMAILS
jgi:hypothetical protein